MKHFYRIYGRLVLSDFTPLKQINNIMKEFGTSEKLTAGMDYHFDVSVDRKLTNEEEKMLIVSTDSFYGECVEYLGMRDE